MALKFSTEGAGENLSLNFTNSQGNAGGTSIYGPVYWQVEYSTDGVNFTVLPESGFCARPFVFWASTMTYCATPGYADRVFILPDALRNQPEVTLLIKARSTQWHRLEHRHGGPGRHGHDHVRHGDQQALADAFRNHSRKE